MKNYFLRKNRSTLFERYWLRAFSIWFFGVFSFFFVLFFANQILFFGKILLELNFSLGESLLYILTSMPSILDWAFPVSLFLSHFWFLRSLIVHNELLAWQLAGVSLRTVGLFLFACSFLLALLFFALNELSERGAYYLHLNILRNWQFRAPVDWIKKEKAVCLGEVALATMEISQEPKVYIIQKLKERKREYLLISGVPYLAKEGLQLGEVTLFSPPLEDYAPYYRGSAKSLFINWQRVGNIFGSSYNTYPLSFLELSCKLFFSCKQADYEKKTMALLWQQKLFTFVASLVLSLWAWFLSLDRYRRCQDAYPLWFGFPCVGFYLTLVSLSRILLTNAWQEGCLIYLWAPVVIISVWSLFLSLTSE